MSLGAVALQNKDFLMVFFPEHVMHGHVDGNQKASCILKTAGTTNVLILCLDLLDYDDYDEHAVLILFDFVLQKPPQMLQLQLLLGSSKGRIQCQCE